MPISITMAIWMSLISTNNGPACLLRNDGGNRNHWLNVRLAGTKSNRDGIGAVVRVESAVGQAVEYGAQRVELLLAERSGADFRIGSGCVSQCGSGMAQRRQTAV